MVRHHKAMPLLLRVMARKAMAKEKARKEKERESKTKEKSGTGKGTWKDRRSQTPQPTGTQAEKTCNEVWERQGNHPSRGKAGLCMWYIIKNNCINGNDCRFSHDKSVQVSAEEKRLCAEHMNHKYSYNDGKQPQRGTSKGPSKGKGGAKARPKSQAREPMKDAQGQNICFVHYDKPGSCTKGKDCSYSHEAPAR